ncbi:glycosyltransferase family 4 protein [Cyanobium sp. ATX 6A2]|nr:glycosyltransferase family 4 protein [Cyanobium sp. ATX 6A2]
MQIGAREHYAVARALHRQGQLRQLITDCWVRPGSLLARIPQARRLAGRFHPDLVQAAVRAPSLRSLAFELRGRLPGTAQGWARTMARNAQFQRWARRQLAGAADQPQALFAYSYAARAVLVLAREQGWRTVLGQIDPGPEEERQVAVEHRRYPSLTSSWEPAPPAYWQAWHQELELADRIVVNSSWSLRCLQRQGVPAHKLCLIPLVYEPAPGQLPAGQPPATVGDGRGARHFQLLFLGTIGLRKGIARLLVAMRLLEGQPVQLTLAGPSELDAVAWAGRPNIRWIGPQPRSAVAALYRAADAMILPTLSDGFALTQLEALAHGCPVIASRHCGEVVRAGLNGWLLEDLEPPTLAATIREAMATAATLPRPLLRPAFGLDQLAAALLSTSAAP